MVVLPALLPTAVCRVALLGGKGLSAVGGGSTCNVCSVYVSYDDIGTRLFMCI